MDASRAEARDGGDVASPGQAGKRTRAEAGAAERGPTGGGDGGEPKSAAGGERMDAWNPDSLLGAMGLGAEGARELPYLAAIQRSFGAHDVSGVRAHVGGAATQAAAAMGSPAFARGEAVVFAEPPDLHMAAHEAAHVIQQRAGVSGGQRGDIFEQHANDVAALVVRGESSEGLLGALHGEGEGGDASGESESGGGGGGGGDAPVQRYEAGEHAKTGDTQENLKQAYTAQHKVKWGETPEKIAKQFQITATELKKANVAKVKKWPTASGKKIEGFTAGDLLSIPLKLNEMARDAIKSPSIQVTIKGVALDYGALIAMGGDLFGSVEQLNEASPEELRELAKLIAEEKATGKPVSAQRWHVATKGRYAELALSNESHFAPSDAGVFASSGTSTDDHKSTWESHHRRAITAARTGKKDQALLLNAFGDHFLTDAFAAGHLFNKADAMHAFNSKVMKGKKKEDREITSAGKGLFDKIAKEAFVGDVAVQFSAHETVEKIFFAHRAIDSASRFSTLLQKVHLEMPELLAGAVAKGVHDDLNTRKEGLPVQNLQDDKWQLSGDATLNAETLQVARKAVAQSQQNVISCFRLVAEPDYEQLFKKVWDFTPRLTKQGQMDVSAAVENGTDLKSDSMQGSVVALIKENYMLLLEKLVSKKYEKLQKIKK